jgi:predicted NBD/HSP70 family sugar kinase
MTGAPTGEQLVLDALRGRRRASRQELVQATGLPKTTVTGVVGRLLQRGVVVEQSLAGSGGRGRPASAIALAGPVGSVGALVFAHTGFRAAVAGFDGSIVAIRRRGLDRPHSNGPSIEEGLALLAEARAEAGERMDCVVLGIPAPFHRGVGVVVGRIPESIKEALPGFRDELSWLHADPAALVSERLGVVATADNDANLAALGEAAFGAGRGLENFIYVKAVDGLGAGLFLNGQLYRGARGLAGELAHVQIDPDGPWCSCGGRGCLARIFGGFVRAFIESTYGTQLSFGDVLELATAGETGTQRVIADVGRKVGRVLADTCMMLCPDAIVIDGALAAAWPTFAAGIREMIERHTPRPVAQTVRLLRGELGERAEVLGAVALARTEHLVDRAM